MTMDPRTQFLLQLLQKLGAPLMSAVNARSSGEDARDATTLSTLLSESVKISISLSQAMNLKTDDGDADAIRVALAALSANLIADSYAQSGRPPTDADARRISKALESVIVFADNFAPAAEHAKRLQTLEGPPPFFDAVQTNIYAIHALLPAIAAISEFSFGQADTRLVQEVSDRLDAKAKELQSTLGQGGNAMDGLVILQALGQIYGGAHRAETKRLKDAGEDQGSASLDAVWKSFDRQVSMLEVLIGSMAGGASSSGGTSKGVAPPQAAPVETAPPELPAPAAPPAQSAPAAASPPAGSSPMAFFKKK